MTNQRHPDVGFELYEAEFEQLVRLGKTVLRRRYLLPDSTAREGNHTSLLFHDHVLTGKVLKVYTRPQDAVDVEVKLVK